MDKIRQINELAAKRKKNVPTGYKGIGNFFGGIFECDWVTPYSISSHNVDADVMIVLQDWCSEEYLLDLAEEKKRELSKLGHDTVLPTNKNLKRFLKEHFKSELRDVYLTNLFPFVKPGEMKADIPSQLLRNSAAEFTIQEIKIVQPMLVVCCGIKVFNALAGAADKNKVKNLNEAATTSFYIDGSHVQAVCHPGALGLANRNKGGIDRNKTDWQNLPLIRRVDSVI